ncbi:MAG TPA: Uma2 family endonuclease [Kofleriaceae bacterium]|nr:Uma2 family endonuclease [Kofleriaceae bacterium]
MVRAGALSLIEPELVRSLKRSEFDRLVELGLFADEHVELIEGTLVKMSPQLAAHASTVTKLAQLLFAQLHGRWIVRSQAPLALSDDSEPEPDLAVVALGNYDASHPTSALLVIEVADSSLRKDRAKAALYARAGVPSYWIVNLAARTLELYASPDGDRYAESRTLRADDTAHLPALELAFVVADILPVTR